MEVIDRIINNVSLQLDDATDVGKLNSYITVIFLLSYHCIIFLKFCPRSNDDFEVVDNYFTTH